MASCLSTKEPLVNILGCEKTQALFLHLISPDGTVQGMVLPTLQVESCLPYSEMFNSSLE